MIIKIRKSSLNEIVVSSAEMERKFVTISSVVDVRALFPLLRI